MTTTNLQWRPRDITSAVERAVELAAIELWGNLKAEAPVDHGRLAGSFQLEGEGLNYAITSGVEYALAVSEGTDPHEIVPVEAQALRFVVEGEVIFARRVQHPGTPGDPYIDRSIEQVQARVPEFVEMALSGL